MRFFELNSGKIVINNFDIAKVFLESLRSSISIIPQETNLFHRSIAENIGYGKLSANQEYIENVAKRAKIHDFIIEYRVQFYDIFPHSSKELVLIVRFYQIS